MNVVNRFAAILGLALASVQAQAVDFSFTSGSAVSPALGNVYTATVSGLTISTTAWATTAPKSRFEAAALNLGSSGMGVCNAAEGAGCTGGTVSALDSSGANDLILFRFSGAVSLQSLTMLQSGGDSDLRMWAGTGTFSPSGLKINQLTGTATTYSNTSNVNGSRTVSLAAYTGSYDWLAISAFGKDRLADYVKLQSLTATPVAQPVPDAASWMTMLAGLGLVAFRVSRRPGT